MTIALPAAGAQLLEALPAQPGMTIELLHTEWIIETNAPCQTVR